MLPLHAVCAVHDVALVDDQVKSALCPTVMLEGLTAMIAVGPVAGTATARVAAFVIAPPIPVQVSV